MTGPGVLCLTLAAAFAQADAPPPELLAELTAQRERIAGLEARFVQETITEDGVYTSRGSIVYTAPRRIIFRYDPEESGYAANYMVDGDRYYEYDEEIRQLTIYEIADRPEADALFAGFENDVTTLTDTYTITVLPEQTGEESIGIELVPRPALAEDALFQKVTLQLPRDSLLPSHLTIVNDESSQVRYQISGYQVNSGISEEKTRLFVPEGTDILDNDEAAGRVGPGGRYFPAESTSIRREALEPAPTVPDP